MARKIYGTRNSGLDDTGDMFEMKVLIGNPLGSSHRRHPKRKISLINLSDGSLEEEFSLPVMDKFEINEDTVFDYLDFFVYSFGDDDGGRHNRQTPIWVTKDKDPVTIKRLPSGVLARFDFGRKDSSSNPLRVAVEVTSESRVPPMWSTRTFTVLKKAFDEKVSFMTLGTNRDELSMTVYFENSTVVYGIPYKEKLDLESAARISLLIAKKKFSSDDYKSVFFLNDDVVPLMWKSIGDFHYLESVDGKLQFTVDYKTQNMGTALAAMQKAIEDSPYSEETKTHIQRDFGENVINALKSDKDENAKIMKICVDMHGALNLFG